MPVKIVFDHPRRYTFRRLWRRILMVMGAVLLVVGIAASIVAVPANVLAAAWFLDEDIDIEFEPGRTLSADEVLLAWAVSTPLAFFGVRRGLRLVRGRRSLVLFLRRFGYDDATSAVTFAVSRTIIVGADLVRARIWEHATDQGVWMRVLNPYVEIVATTFDGRLPVDAIAFSLPGMFAILAVGLAGVVIALGTALTAAPLAWVLTAVFLFFASFPADTVREAEQLKTRAVQNSADIDSAAHLLAQWSRRVFGPGWSFSASRRTSGDRPSAVWPRCRQWR